MRAVAITTSLLLSALFAGCTATNNSSFDRERQALERTMPSESRLLSSAGAHRNGGTLEASWQYEMAGKPDTARTVLRAAFDNQYQLVHEAADNLSFARFDGADSFYLTFSLQSQGTGPTLINVLLKTMPG